ncbi:MAG: hypothetical protein CSA15_11805 [Candidatus Delongbacteria bacterium]|nr:MAG: hypothetical protein CSA15_11805 [Candidatus Delongbacteria bacterium]
MKEFILMLLVAVSFSFGEEKNYDDPKYSKYTITKPGSMFNIKSKTFNINVESAEKLEEELNTTRMGIGEELSNKKFVCIYKVQDGQGNWGPPTVICEPNGNNCATRIIEVLYKWGDLTIK